MTDSTFVAIAPAVCERLLGDPTSRSSREWRWRRQGIVSDSRSTPAPGTTSKQETAAACWRS